MVIGYGRQAHPVVAGALTVSTSEYSNTSLVITVDMQTPY